MDWRSIMAESVYKVIQLVGTSTDSWEKAAAAAIERAAGTVRDLRVAEVADLDVVVENGVVSAYRAKLNVSFKYEDA
jgi:dodecin